MLHLLNAAAGAAALAAALAQPTSGSSSGSVTVIGSSSARMCYEAAESALTTRNQEISYCDQALAEGRLIQSDLVATHINRGILRQRRSDYDGAVADFERARAIDPGYPETYLNHGALLLRREQAGPARDMFTAAIERRTRRPALAHYGRGIANETLGDLRAAYNDYRRATELAPDWRDPQVELRRFRVRQ